MCAICWWRQCTKNSRLILFPREKLVGLLFHIFMNSARDNGGKLSWNEIWFERQEIVEKLGSLIREKQNQYTLRANSNGYRTGTKHSMIVAEMVLRFLSTRITWTIVRLETAVSKHSLVSCIMASAFHHSAVIFHPCSVNCHRLLLACQDFRQFSTILHPLHYECRCTHLKAKLRWILFNCGYIFFISVTIMNNFP